MEDKFIQSGEIEKYIGIGKTKITEIIRNGNFVKPIFINGFSYPLYSVAEIQKWMEEQKQKRHI
ncbi:helix-turn-helix transcriptional regulator [Aliarcobacter cryaerophilus]|jgi:predicted DNA-binding transcriptional regulator AlpA|uniref:helix-turn-helix transcriptional regulator n=1 Tax=Aliarcobacter cryaerophilus TaxID=28198 RepID=UPI003DA4B369